MITYTPEAQARYLFIIEQAQHKLAELPVNALGYELTHWLIHTALEDLKKQVQKEHE